jgi:hypothetical protein
LQALFIDSGNGHCSLNHLDVGMAGKLFCREFAHPRHNTADGTVNRVLDGASRGENVFNDRCATCGLDEHDVVIGSACVDRQCRKNQGEDDAKKQ